VAYLGARLLLKGWPWFEALAVGLADDDRYEFCHLGVDAGDPLPASIRNIPVRVTPEMPDAMVAALSDNGVDVVVIWSLARETFCYAAIEALAGGAFVVARLAAGNVWPMVEQHAPLQGCAVADETALDELFGTGRICDLVARSSRHRGMVEASGGTADWLLRSPDGC
jgi:hypothetical protein